MGARDLRNVVIEINFVLLEEYSHQEKKGSGGVEY